MNTNKKRTGNTRWPLVCLLFLCVSATCISTPAQTTPSIEPTLRIETGMHTGDIWGIAVDAGNRLLVTASKDKTIRVWELQSGRLLRTIRVPIGPDTQGELYAVALSPDGNTIAVGGSSTNKGGNESIYVFNRASGRLIHRLEGLPNFVLYLTYSPDGRYLLATLGGSNGIRLFSSSNYVLTGEDKDYADSTMSANFDRRGKLVTGSLDGFIRVYLSGQDGSLRLVAKQNPRRGVGIQRVSISPDSSRIAVAFVTSNKPMVVRTDDLTPLFEPDITGIKNGALTRITWSADGTMLYAGGTASDANNLNFIRVWSDAGRGDPRDVVAADQIILHLLPLSDGGVVYSTGEPSFGVISAATDRRLFIVSPIILYNRNRFLVSSDGTGVGFTYEGLKTPAYFSVSDRKLEAGQPNRLSFLPPETDDQNLRVVGWNYTPKPKVNGIQLKLGEYETSYSLALAPDKRAFLLGTSFHVRLFDRNGAELWRKPSYSTTFAVNIARNNKVAVAAHGDGTIRWYRMSDGKELLAFFPHADRKRWVLWTPSGYYDASPGAEELIGWHVNNGPDKEADFFPVGQFRSTYYRPDVVSRILTTGDEQFALKEANEEAGRKQQQADVTLLLPPVLEIISPRDGSEVSSTDVVVQFRVRSPSGEPVTGLKVLVDGRPSLSRQLVREETTKPEETREIRVTVPERDSEISLIAENRFATSVPATLRVKWRGSTAAQPATFIVKPKLYILAVGVSRYSNEKFNLKLADKDASDFVRAMVAQKGLLYRDVVVKLLTNEEATKDEILDGLDWIRKETTSNDMAMVFFAGHGVNDQNNYYYFCPYNVDPNRLLRTGLTFSDIRNTVSAIAGKALFFVDTCHSGNSIGLSTRRGPLDINIIINELASAENGVVVFSASTGNESSLEREEWNNGAFTKALVEGINGAAALGNSGRITYNMLNLYISERVKELTKGLQHPTMISPKTVADFPIAVKR
ncbi:MAG TPA: caspase family protein [Pyrinomonadaceae bacterium]